MRESYMAAGAKTPGTNPPAIVWRPYQRNAVNAAVIALKAGKAALLVLPTGSGKSLLAADTVARGYTAGLRSLIVCPTRELVTQDADAVARILRAGMRVTIACAGLGEIDLSGDVVIGTPQTLVRRLERLGRVDILVVDEAHRLGRKASGQIFRILSTLRERNPALMVLGLTATGFRHDSGRLTEGPDAVFDEIAYAVDYLELVAAGYLAPLVGPKSKLTARMRVKGLRLVAGDYAAADLARFDRADLTAAIADEIVAHGAERRSWLVFAVSVAHAKHLAAALRQRGVDARVLVGSTPKAERADLVAAFKAGKVRCLVGCDVFSTGFDAPAVDLIAIARPTASPVWHVQSAGRGTRLADGKRNCLVLDFAGNFQRLGPIDSPRVRAKGQRAADDDDEPASRECERCASIIAKRARSCSVCGAVLVEPKPRRFDHLTPRAAGHSTIMGRGVFPVLNVSYARHEKPGRPDSLRITYRLRGFTYRTKSEFLCCWHPGRAGEQARAEWLSRLRAGAPYMVPPDAASAAAVAGERLVMPERVRIPDVDAFPVPLFARERVAS